MSRPVKRVVIVGRDLALWASAHSVLRAFARAGVSVRVIDTGPTLGVADVFTAMPALKTLHLLLALDDEAVLKTCATTFPLAQRFAGWGDGQAPFLHPYDTQGVALNQVDFLQYWVKARGEGLNVALEDFSLAAAAAKQRRFIVYNDETANYSKGGHGFHLNAVAYALLVRHRAVKLGAEVIHGKVRDVARSGARIDSVTLDDGQTIEGDLFIDASGPDAVLIGGAPGAAFESWRCWFPCDRMLSASARQLDPIPAFSQITAFRNGWFGLFPLQDRTAVTAMFNWSADNDESVAREVSALSGMTLDNVVITPLHQGARAQSWVGNCVAIGESAATLEPLDAVELHVLQLGLSHLVALFPVDADDMAEAAIFNASMNAYLANLRNFQIAHYKLNARRGEPMWDRARDMDIPESLAYKIDLFRRRGKVAVYDQETFQDENWKSIFIGHGLMPAEYDPLVDRVAREELIENFRRMLRFIAVEVMDMPSLEARLELSAPRTGKELF